MRRRVGQFEREVFEAIRGRENIELPPITRERLLSTIKLRFRIKRIPNGFIQFYYNEDNGKTSMALIAKEQRIYGHDFTPRTGWHRHLPPNGRHNHSKESKKPVSIEEFLKKADEIIETY